MHTRIVLVIALLALTVVGLPATNATARSPLHAALAQQNMTTFRPRPPVPQTVFRDAHGYELTLAEFHGQVVLLVFWATWCPNCRKELPQIDRLQAELGDEGLKVVALSIDPDGSDAVAPYFAKNGIENLSVYVVPKQRIKADFGARGVPSSVLIDRRGRVISAKRGGTQWDSRDGEAFLRHYLHEPDG